MRNLFAYIFLLFFAALSLQQITVLSVYILNQDVITEKFCVNKDKPELACKGKCHMKDMMAKQEEKKDATIHVELLVAMYFQNCVQEMPEKATAASSHFSYLSPLSDVYESEMFQPPRWV